MSSKKSDYREKRSANKSQFPLDKAAFVCYIDLQLIRKSGGTHLAAIYDTAAQAAFGLSQGTCRPKRLGPADRGRAWQPGREHQRRLPQSGRARAGRQHPQGQRPRHPGELLPISGRPLLRASAPELQKMR